MNYIIDLRGYPKETYSKIKMLYKHRADIIIDYDGRVVKFRYCDPNLITADEAINLYIKKYTKDN